MQTVQNITVDDRVSRTQYQYTLEDPDFERTERLEQPLLLRNCKACRSFEESQPTNKLAGSRYRCHRPRHCLKDLELLRPPSTTRCTTLFGQRQINTMYTQLNQYHVILGNRTAVSARIPIHCRIFIFRPTASSARSGPGSFHFVLGSGSASAGSNATTGPVLYTPTAAFQRSRRHRRMHWRRVLMLRHPVGVVRNRQLEQRDEQCRSRWDVHTLSAHK